MIVFLLYSLGYRIGTAIHVLAGDANEGNASVFVGTRKSNVGANILFVDRRTVQTSNLPYQYYASVEL